MCCVAYRLETWQHRDDFRRLRRSAQRIVRLDNACIHALPFHSSLRAVLLHCLNTADGARHRGIISMYAATVRLAVPPYAARDV